MTDSTYLELAMLLEQLKALLDELGVEYLAIKIAKK